MASPSVLKATVLLALFSHCFAATCNTQTRASGDPSGAQLTAFLNSNNTLANFCTQNSDRNSTQGTVSLSFLQLSFQHSNASANLVYCSEAFSNIISQCIKPDMNGTYGGTWTKYGETYNITDVSYPKPPVIPSSISASGITSNPGPSSRANSSSMVASISVNSISVAPTFKNSSASTSFTSAISSSSSKSRSAITSSGASSSSLPTRSSSSGVAPTKSSSSSNTSSNKPSTQSSFSSAASLTSSRGPSSPSSSISSAALSHPTTSSNPNTSTSSKPAHISTFPTPPPNLVISAGDLGAITLGPQTSTESGSFTSKQTGIPGLTANSATTTSTDGHNTILPIWFLSSGIGVIELPGPGIDPGGIIPPPPGFPPLFIGSDGSPTAGGHPEGTKDPQTSSTDNPTSNNPTSNNPTSTKLTSTNPTSNPTTSKPTSSSSSSSSSSSACTAGCSSCYTYGGDGSTVPADNGGNDNAVKRSQQTRPPSIAGRIPLSHQLDKRADNFDTFNPGTPSSCKLSKSLIIPNYPSPASLPKKQSDGAKMWWVMTETTAPNTCPILDYNMVSDADVTSQKINPADAKTYAKGGDWSRTNPAVNTDHVYELSVLKQYFSSRITATNCKDFKAIFDVADTGSPQVPGDTRLQTIWRQLPSNTNPDFAGMDSKINAIKAQAFSNAFSNPAGSNNSLGYLYQLALAMKLTNDPLVSPLFAKTNNRIYAALLAMDALIAGNCNNNTIQADWASSYKKWITEMLTSAGINVNNKVSSILNNNNLLGPSARVGPGSTTGADGQSTATTNSIGRGVAAFLQAYPTPDAFTFTVGNLVSFPTTSTANIKRQACSKPPPSTSAPPPTSKPSSPVPISSSPSKPSSSAPLKNSSVSVSTNFPKPSSSAPLKNSSVSVSTSFPKPSSSAPLKHSFVSVGTQAFIPVSTAPPATTSTTKTSSSQLPTSTTPQPTPLESCHTHYAFLWDTFDIYGLDWDTTKLDGSGAAGSGDGLHDQLSGCSKVTHWSYTDLTPDASSPWQFHASGRTTIWQKHCIEDAITSSGAPENSCGGSG